MNRTMQVLSRKKIMALAVEKEIYSLTKLGDEIRAAQHAVGSKFGKNTIHDAMGGQFSGRTLSAICDYLQCSAGDIMETLIVEDAANTQRYAPAELIPAMA